ncbi:hypothetical protein COCC4DRAFT_32773, partial [Bipolaris maydis ATCC 48331]
MFKGVHWGYGVNVWSCFARLCTCGSPTLILNVYERDDLFMPADTQKWFFFVSKHGISSIEYTLESYQKPFF